MNQASALLNWAATRLSGLGAGILGLGVLGCFPASVSHAAPTPAPAAAPAASEIPKPLDPSGLTPSETDSLRRLLEKLPSPCGKSHSLLTSIRSDAKCSIAPHAGKWIVKLLNDGSLESEVEEAYQARYLNTTCYQIDTEGAAVRGDPKAPVTIVEFSDFECPHCKGLEPILKQMLEENSKVKLVFMNYPLPMHPSAANGAAAAIAAGKQGKFWAYHDKLFENQTKMSMADLVRYAQELKLDVKRFQEDLEAARPRVAKEKAAGEKLKITGTPSFFINCRRAEGINSIEILRSFVETELNR